MKVSLFLIFMICTLYFVIKNFYKQGQAKELSAFIILMVYSTYMGIAVLQSLPLIQLIEPTEKVFSSVGHWFENTLNVMNKPK